MHVLELLPADDIVSITDQLDWVKERRVLLVLPNDGRVARVAHLAPLALGWRKQGTPMNVPAKSAADQGKPTQLPIAGYPLYGAGEPNRPD